MKTATIYLNNSPAVSSRIRTIAWSAVKRLTPFVAVISVLIMASDGPYFPWANLCGAGVLALIAWRANLLEGNRPHA
jgi:hypothetical protein